MNGFDFVLLLIGVLLLAALHTLGEILYKKGGMIALSQTEDTREVSFWKGFATSPLVLLSLLMSAGVKVLYGILLVSNPLYLTGGMYLAAVALFSVLGGGFIFKERITVFQGVGFFLIAIGMILLV